MDELSIVRDAMRVRMENAYKVRCYKPDGSLRWEEQFDNIVVNVGLAALLNNTFFAVAGAVTWYVGLVDGATTPTYAGSDQMSSHAGWTENTGYSQAARPTWTPNSAATGAPASPPTMANSSSLATFSINASGTIAGAFLASVSTKAGTTGTLYGEGNFAASRSVLSGDTMTVEVDLSAITQ